MGYKAAITRQQRDVLHAVSARQTTTAQEIADDMPGNVTTYDQIHACLARLERRGLVQRRQLPGRAATGWTLTSDGENLIQDDEA